MLPVAVGPESLISLFLSGRPATTMRTYAQALDRFRAFVQAPSVQAAIDLLLSCTPGQANYLVLRYRSSMVEAGRSAASTNLSLGALRSLLRTARTIGLVAWSLDVPGVRKEVVRDTRGPGHSAICEGLVGLHLDEAPIAVRNCAVIHLLYDLALRTGEVVSLDLDHLDLQTSRLLVLGKGRSGREWLSVPAFTGEALSSWLKVRGAAPGPLFVSLRGPHRPRARLSGRDVWRIVSRFGASVGVPMRPHGLRHTSITEVCKLAQQNGVGLEEVCQFSRHKDISTLLIYRDRERDVQGALSSMLSERVRLEVS